MVVVVAGCDIECLVRLVAVEEEIVGGVLFLVWLVFGLALTLLVVLW